MNTDTRPMIAKKTMEEHIHDWQTAPRWGVIIGLSKCQECQKVASRADFPAIFPASARTMR